MSEANKRQVGGSHYKQADGGEEHWDRVYRLGLDYFQAQITKYVERWKLKNGLTDLKKAHHVLEKYIELNEPERVHDLTVEQLAAQIPNDAPQVVQAVQDFMSTCVLTRVGQVKPTGWVGFTFEGVVANSQMFTCIRCKQKLNVSVTENPYAQHASCPDGGAPYAGMGTLQEHEEVEAASAVLRGYVRQEGDAA